MNSSRMDYVLICLERQGISPTRQTETGNLPQRVLSILPAQGPITTDEIDLAIHSQEAEFRRKHGSLEAALHISAYLLPTNSPYSFARADVISLEVSSPQKTAFVSYDILGDKAYPFVDEYATRPATDDDLEEVNAMNDKSLLDPVDAQVAIDHIIAEFLRLTR